MELDGVDDEGMAGCRRGQLCFFLYEEFSYVLSFRDLCFSFCHCLFLSGFCSLGQAAGAAELA